jgi:hypothetical protein
MDEATDAGRAFAPKITTAAKALCALIAASLLLLPFRSDDRIADKPLSEDGYYALTVARNIALGRGVTIDGKQLTNGFQPLFTFLTVPAFAASPDNRYVPLRLVLLLHWAVLLATATVLGLMARDAWAGGSAEERRLRGWVAGLLYLGSLHVFALHFNGLETGFVLLMYALCWRMYQVRGVQRWTDALLMGVLLGLTVLARIDASFLVALFCLYLLVERGMRPTQRSGRAIVVGAVSLIVSSPWWLYNRLCFGSFMPSSGTAQMGGQLDAQRLERALRAVTEAMLPMAYMGQLETPAVTMVRMLVLIGLGALLLQWWPKPEPDGRRLEAWATASARTLAFGGCVFAAAMILVVWYTGSSKATHFYTRYFAPVSLVSVVVLSYVGLELSRRTPRLMIAAAAVLTAGFIGAVWLIAAGRMGASSPMYVAQLPLVRENVPDNEVAAAGQSGTLGYFRDNVLNLDGKVNPEALKYRGRIWEYLRERNVRWFCDWENYLDTCLGEAPERHGWRVVDERDDFYLLRYAPDADRGIEGQGSQG